MNLEKAMKTKKLVIAKIVGESSNGDLQCEIEKQDAVLPKSQHSFKAPYSKYIGQSVEVLIDRYEDGGACIYLDQIGAEEVRMNLIYKAFEKNSGITIQEQEEEEETPILDLLKQDMQQQRILFAEVIKVDKVGDLHVVIEKRHAGELHKIGGFIKNINVDGRIKSPATRAAVLKQGKVLCTIVDIDPQTQKVELESNEATGRIRAFKSKEFIAQIDEVQGSSEYEKSKKKENRYTDFHLSWPRVTGKVVYLARDNKRVTLDLLNLNMQCFVRIDYWRHGRIYEPQEEIHIGDVVEVDLVGYHKNKDKPGMGLVFIGNRKTTLPNPWDTVDERFSVGESVKVRCMKKGPDKFFGQLFGEELDILVYYKGKKGNLTYSSCEYGMEYIVEITEVDKKRKRLLAHFDSVVPG